MRVNVKDHGDAGDFYHEKPSYLTQFTGDLSRFWDFLCTYVELLVSVKITAQFYKYVSPTVLKMPSNK